MKHPIESRTLWVAGLTASAGLIAALSGAEWIAAHPQLVAVLAVILGSVNFVLRLLTNEEIGSDV